MLVLELAKKLLNLNILKMCVNVKFLWVEKYFIFDDVKIVVGLVKNNNNNNFEHNYFFTYKNITNVSINVVLMESFLTSKVFYENQITE